MSNIDINHLISDHNNITVFRHVSPDGDAVFSQHAIKQFFQDNFPQKTVKCLGNDILDIYPYTDRNVSDEFIRSSLAFVVDTATKERVDDQRWKMADVVIKIDHHPGGEDFGDYNYVDPSRASCCEYLTYLYFLPTFSQFKKSRKFARLLYAGIISDTINFTTTSTSASTLELAGKLASMDINISDIYDIVNAIDLSLFEKITKLRSCFRVEDKFGYCLLDSEELDKLQMSCQDAKNAVAEFSKIRDINIWAVIAYNRDRTAYEASLRSKKGYAVNQTAMKYGGGGHVNASGIKGLSREEALKLIEELKALSVRQAN